jgi:predicted nucleic acid-binding protein
VSRIFWDSNLYIYLFEDHPIFAMPTRLLRQRMRERGDALLTSAFTIGEVQVKPRRQQDHALADNYGAVIRQSSTILVFDGEAAERYGRIRENPAIRPPDAIQLSCAAAAGVELFITNDRSLQRLTIPGIHFIAPLSHNLL